jgi:dihydrolipoamide dehydrogenase
MEATVSRLASGIKLLLKSNGVNSVEGEAHLDSQTKNKVVVNGETIESKNIVLATGSYPVCLPGYEFGENILSTTSLLELEDIPESLTIIGGRYSGCELASIYNALGCKVSLIEAEDHLMPFQIEEIGNAVKKYMMLDGINVLTKARVDKISDTTVIVNGEAVVAEKILVCTGRRPNIATSELSNIGLKFGPEGIIVDKKMRTNVDSIYAVGDVTGLYELAHVASKQGEVAAENIMGRTDSTIDYASLPVCVFTYPEVAFVGELDGRSGEFPLTASAKANCMGETRGLVKAFEKEGRLVGTYVIAPHAGETIGEPALAIKMNLSPKDIGGIMHAHPTLPESFSVSVKYIYSQAKNLTPKKLST